MIEMYHRFAIYTLVALLLAGSSVVFASGTAAAVTPPPGPPPADWTGFLTIMPDGSLSNPTAPVIQNGSTYTLVGNITGTVSISYSGAIFDGNGYSITSAYGFSPLQISYAGNVDVYNTVLYSWYASDISIMYSTNVTIHDNTIYAMAVGVFVYSPYNHIMDNEISILLTEPGFHGASAGIMVKASHTVVTGNNITLGQVGYGIVVDAGKSLVQANSVEMQYGNSIGIATTGTDNTLQGNYINGTGTDLYGISLQSGSQFSNITDNMITLSGTRAVGIASMDGFNNIAENELSVEGSYSYGIVLAASGSGYSQVFGNNISDAGLSSTAIYDTSQGSTIMDNVVMVTGNSTRGISSSQNSKILSNSIEITGNFTYGISAKTGSAFDNTINLTGVYNSGMYISGGSGGIYSGNMIVVGGVGVYGTFLNGQYITYTDNVITAGFDGGIALYSSSLTYSHISANTLANSSTGIMSDTYQDTNLVYSGNNVYNDTVAFVVKGIESMLFYHNNFVNYTSYQITGSSGNATWDNGYPSGGNYWYTYEGNDIYSGPFQNLTGSDGIGDVQFNVTVNNIDHYPLMNEWTSPNVTFVESGLPLGTDWTVTFNGIGSTADHTSISYDIQNASYSPYSYTIHPVSGYTQSLSSGTVQYEGSSIVVHVVYTKIPEPSYNVVFTQTGLPSGTPWSVVLNGTTQTSTGSSLTFDPQNGTYTYTVNRVNGYSPDSQTGTVVVNGNDATVQIAFTQVTYSVTFETVGLPSGMKWYVNLSNGQSFSSTSSIISFNLPNGSYGYSVSNVSTYNATPTQGLLQVTGHSPDSIQINFQQNNTVPSGNTPGGFSLLEFIIGLIIGGGAVGAAMAILYYRRNR